MAIKPDAGQRAPEQTHEEARYLKHLKENDIPVCVCMVGGEKVSGVVEFYDVNFIRLTRMDGPNLFIFKHDIKYLYEIG